MKRIGSLIIVLTLFALMALGSGSTSSSSGTVTNTDSSDTEVSNEKEESTDTDAKNGDEADSEKDAGEQSNVVKLGGSFEKDGLKFTFKKANTDFTPSDDEYGLYKPAKGKKFVACTFTFENNGTKDSYVSSYDFDCYADDESCEQTFISTSDFKNTDFSADDLSPGRKVTFTSFYEVPKKAKSIQLEYESNFWTDEKIIIEVE